MMQRDEDGEPAISFRDAPTTKLPIVGIDPGAYYRMPTRGQIMMEAENHEREIRESEPYSSDDATLKGNDVRATAYMNVWGHYECAYNAVQHREMVDDFARQINDLIEAITGRPVDPKAERFIGRDLWEATQERARLLTRLERMQGVIDWLNEVVTLQENALMHIANLAGGIRRVDKEALRGVIRKARADRNALNKKGMSHQ